MDHSDASLQPRQGFVTSVAPNQLPGNLQHLPSNQEMQLSNTEYQESSSVSSSGKNKNWLDRVKKAFSRPPSRSDADHDQFNHHGPYHTPSSIRTEITRAIDRTSVIESVKVSQEIADCLLDEVGPQKKIVCCVLGELYFVPRQGGDWSFSGIRGYCVLLSGPRECDAMLNIIDDQTLRTVWTSRLSSRTIYTTVTEWFHTFRGDGYYFGIRARASNISFVANFSAQVRSRLHIVLLAEESKKGGRRQRHSAETSHKKRFHSNFMKRLSFRKRPKSLVTPSHLHHPAPQFNPTGNDIQAAALHQSYPGNQPNSITSGHGQNNINQNMSTLEDPRPETPELRSPELRPASNAGVRHSDASRASIYDLQLALSQRIDDQSQVPHGGVEEPNESSRLQRDSIHPSAHATLDLLLGIAARYAEESTQINNSMTNAQYPEDENNTSELQN